jgi:Leucine-rich repeat (LRR) protein
VVHLILDDNSVQDLDGIGSLPLLETLSLKKNGMFYSQYSKI